MAKFIELLIGLAVITVFAKILFGKRPSGPTGPTGQTGPEEKKGTENGK